jgi:hypothetical protein
MKLSTYISLLESIRFSEKEDLDVFIPEAGGDTGRGVWGTREPPAPYVVPLLNQSGSNDAVFVKGGSKFRHDFTRTYTEVGKAVRLV